MFAGALVWITQVYDSTMPKGKDINVVCREEHQSKGVFPLVGLLDSFSGLMVDSCHHYQEQTCQKGFQEPIKG